MDLIKDFKNLGKDDVALAGGKGASLGEMTQAGIPVPGGFVVLSNAFEKFLEETDLNVKINSILREVDPKKIHTIEKASKKIKSLIISKKIPKDIKDDIQKFFKKLNTKFVAVRSSATVEDSSSAAWAGQLESFLNTTDKNLLENVKKCWASLFTSRAIFYRFEKKLHKQKISVAVVVQKMVESEKSGVAFSVHPVTQDENQIIIEAGFGLGEAIVSGQITPDNYIIEKQPKRIIDKNIQIQSRGLYCGKKEGCQWRNIPKAQGEKQVLSDKEILKLSKIILNIEKHYGFPCDIEWAFEKNKFYIVQSRPITTLSKKVYHKLSADDEVINKIKTFIKANDLDIQAAKTSVFFMSICYSSYVDSKNVHGSELSQIYFYIKNNYFHQISALDDLKKITNIYYQDALNGGDKFKQFIQQQNNLINKLLDKGEKIKGLPNRQIEVIDKIRDWWKSSLFGEDKGMVLEDDIKQIFIDKKCDSKEIKSIVRILAVPEKLSVFTKERKKFYELCINVLKKEISDKKIEEYIKEYFYIETNFYDCSVLTIDLMRKKLEKEIKDKNIEYFEEEIKKIEKNAKEIIADRKQILQKFNFSKLDLIKLDFLHEFSDWLNIRKENMMKTFYFMSKVLHEISDTKKIPYDDLAYYTFVEVKELVLKNIKILQSEIEKRRQGCFAEIKKNNISFIYGAKAQKLLDLVHNIEDSNVIKGKVAYSAGKVVGKVKIIKDPLKESFHSGEILVTSMTRIDFVPLMKKAKAIITDEGGISCHAAIVSRELKVPCVIGTKNATRILKDGDNIEIDTENGIIKIKY